MAARTRWYCARFDVGRRFPHVIHFWAVDEDEAREQIARNSPNAVLISLEQQHR